MDGRLELGSNSSVGSRITCRDAVIGPGTEIKGPVNVSGSITVCDRAKLSSIYAGGDVILRPGIEVGDVKCDGTLFVYGKVKSGKLFGRQVKVLRADAIANNDFPEEITPDY